MMSMKRPTVIAVGVLAILAGALLLAQSTRSPAIDPAKEWPTYGHDPGGMRYSSLSQINRSNVQQLQRVWTYEVPRTPNSWIESFESTPLMVDDVLYFATQMGRAIAVDAETGKERWVFDRSLERAWRRPAAGCQSWSCVLGGRITGFLQRRAAAAGQAHLLRVA